MYIGISCIFCTCTIQICRTIQICPFSYNYPILYPRTRDTCLLLLPRIVGSYAIYQILRSSEGKAHYDVLVDVRYGSTLPTFYHTYLTVPTVHSDIELISRERQPDDDDALIFSSSLQAPATSPFAFPRTGPGRAAAQPRVVPRPQVVPRVVPWRHAVPWPRPSRPSRAPPCTAPPVFASSLT